MLIRELLDINQNVKYDVNEDWKKTAANLGLAGAIGLAGAGGAAISDKISQWAKSNTAQKGQVVSGKVIKAKEPKELDIQALTNNPLEKKLMQYASQAGMVEEELAQFLAQCAHETLNFKKMVESGSANYFKRYEKKYAPKRAKRLGNIYAGDGARYKGRGYIQLTGRYNYALAEKALGLPLVKKPELAAEPDIAAKIAVWYWKSRVKSSVSDFSDTTAVTRKINSNLHGLENRNSIFAKYIGIEDEN
jgi:putative chitinase